MELKLMAQVHGLYVAVGAIVEVPELHLECFEPLKTTNDPIFAYVNRELPFDDMKVKIVMKTREDAADILAKALAKLLVCEMRKHDTHNGYPIKET